MILTISEDIKKYPHLTCVFLSLRVYVCAFMYVCVSLCL